MMSPLSLGEARTPKRFARVKIGAGGELAQMGVQPEIGRGSNPFAEEEIN
jgi:hypothetical protein